MYMYLSLFVCLVGLLIYALTNNNGKLLEIGRIMFAFGLLVWLFLFSSRAVELFK